MRLKFILTTIIFGLFGQVHACKCGGPGTIKESFKSTDLIVYGKVRKIDTVALSETIKEEDVKEIKERLRDDKQKLEYFEMNYVLKIEFDVNEKFKGKNSLKKIVIYTPMMSATCGYRFKINKEYIVYASTKNFLTFMFQKEKENKNIERENTFWTNHCTRTTEYSKLEADELGLLKEIE